MRSAPQPLTRVLYSSRSGFRNLIRHAEFLQAVELALSTLWPAEMALQVKVADCSNGRLLLIVSSGVWSTRLRYQHADIRRILAQKLRLGIEQIDVRVRPVYEAAPPTPAKRELSGQTRRLIAESARHIDNDNLAAALERLSRSGV